MDYIVMTVVSRPKEVIAHEQHRPAFDICEESYSSFNSYAEDSQRLIRLYRQRASPARYSSAEINLEDYHGFKNERPRDSMSFIDKL